jgi:N-acetylglucosaminyldiphosphoundecaprenol N-acetyl-beta-D-mannosaminyltransferase
MPVPAGGSFAEPSGLRAPAATIPRVNKIDLGLLRLAVAGMEDALKLADLFVKDGKQHYFCFCESKLLTSAILDPELARALESADAIFPDGIALMALARLKGHSPPERIPGPRFLLAACAYGVERGWRHFFYGGASGVADKLAERLREQFPEIIIAGTYSPPFRPLSADEELADKSMIELAKPDLLWVCLGSPKQERWCAEHVGKISVPLTLAVGAAFDFHTRQQPWAPAWVRKVGLEWLFRTLTGGRKNFGRNLKAIIVVALYLAKASFLRLLIWRKSDTSKFQGPDKN